jgi:uncharacterized delta-60 repeat protein
MKIFPLVGCLLGLATVPSALAAPGDADAGFVPVLDREVSSISVQPDGKILIGGEFGTVNGVTRSRLARLNGDGTLDTTFNPGPNAGVYCSAVQQDGSILLGGDFTSLGGVARNRIARVKSSGSLDTTFDPNANGVVRALLVQPDGRIIIAGDFTQIGTTARNRVARLNTDGTLDTTFAPDVNGTVYSLSLQGDGKVVAGGSFTSVGSVRRNHVARLSASGALDAAFNVSVGTGLFTAVYCVAVQADGKILIGGSFNTIGADTRNRLARINANGTLDAGFHPDIDSWVNAIAVQADGKILLAGFFNAIDGLTRNHLARLDAAGAVDAGFVANADDHVFSLALQGDGKVLVGGLFLNAAGAARTHLARIDNNGIAETLNALTASRIQWLRGGAAPEAQAVRFDVSANAGVTWTTLGFAKRIAGGWELNGGAVAATSMLRGRAVVAGGIGSGSSGIVETVVNISLPTVVTQPATNITAVEATLNGTVNARGTDRSVSFEYGTTTAYGTVVTGVPATASGNAVTAASADIAGLLGHTRYYYRALAASTVGGSAGANATFVTGNRAPAPVADTAMVLPGAVVTLLVRANDVDDDGDALSISSFTQPGAAVGKVTKAGNALVFTAATTFAGGTFDYVVSDGFGGKGTATVTLTPGTSAINPTTKTVASAATSYDIDVTATGFWSAVETLSWASVAPAASENDDTVTVTVMANTGKAARTGTIKIGGKTHTLTQAGVLPPAVAVPGAIPTGLVGAPYALTVPTTNFPVTYTVGKMPPGLTIDKTTGLISGQPTAAGTYAMSLKASNAAGSSATINFSITIDALPAAVVGTYHGSIEAHALINGNLGSRFELTTTAAGAFSGKIISSNGQSFAGKLLSAVADPNHPTCHAILPRPGKTPLTLDLTLDAATDTLAGTLDDGLAHVLPVAAWRNAWSTLNKATAFKTLHSFCLEQPNPDPALPGGHGYGAFTVAENSGLLTVAGRLADGSSLTTSTFIGQQGQLLLYQVLYGARGSFNGMVTVTVGGTPADNTLAGTGTWFKMAAPAASTDLVYRNGFGPLPITIEGAAYPVPAPGAVVMGLPNVADKALLTFTGGGLEDEGKEFGITFSLLNPSATGLTNKATFPALNPNKVGLPNVNFMTGAFSGEFTIPDATPALSRKVVIQGQIVKRPGGIMGCGFGLLPKLPVPPQTVGSTPKRSVRVELDAAP